MPALLTPKFAGIEVVVRGLRKSFGSQEVLRGIDMELKSGEIFVLMGPSGSGKSVLLRQLMGLESVDGGTIEFFGETGPTNRRTLNAGEYRRAMVFQSGGLLNSLTVAENVGLYLTEHRLKSPSEIDRVVREKLQLVQIGDESLAKFPTELSGGMRKRVAIARALVMEPQLVLYDEPTSELDPLVAQTIGQEIVALNRRTGATTLVVTHDRDLAFGIAHRLAFLSDGRLEFVGEPEALRRHSHPVLQRFLSANFLPG